MSERRETQSADIIMDGLLSNIPYEAAPPDLAPRICQNIMRWHRRRITIRLTTSSILAVAGLWLMIPVLNGWLSPLNQPFNGVEYLYRWLQAGMDGSGAILGNVLSQLSTLQSNLQTVGNSAWLGLIALAFSAVVLLDFLLPREGIS